MSKEITPKKNIDKQNYALKNFAEGVSNKAVMKDACHICKSAHRKAIEDEYIRTRSYQDAFSLANGKDSSHKK